MKIPIVLLLAVVWVTFHACVSDPSSNQPPPSDPIEPSPQEEVQADHDTPRAPGIKEDYINTNRVIWQKPDLVIDLLPSLEGKTVADIGAGTGFFALRLAPLSEKVIAIDIDRQFIDYLDSIKIYELPEQFQPKLETRLAEPSDPNLADDEADVVLIVNTYMYIRDRRSYLNTLQRGMAPNGELLIIDFKRKRTPIGPPQDLRVPLYRVEEELLAAGFQRVETNDTALDYQYIIIARKTPD